MEAKDSPQERELYQRIDEVLHYLWDPIGIAGEPYARNKYCPYIPAIFNMVKSGKNASEISRYLADIACNVMELKPDHKNCNKVAEILLAFKRKIFENDV